MALKKHLNNFEEYVCVFGMATMTAVVFLQVIMRYVFSNSLSWSEEFSRYVFIWISWLGASYAVRENSHFRFKMLADKLEGNARRCLELFVLLAWFTFCFFLAWYGTRLVLFLIARGQISAAMEIPMSLPYAAVPIGVGCMCIRLIIEMWKVIKEMTKGERGQDMNKKDEMAAEGGL
jgi:TRAP-type C4-dicarboxylate transport system permease small subunit